ncbi:MAG: hypothetical protein FD123_1382 [Bacteroidetes bacterium]|nr:MAG: hypothetical protein FD123_1382 [Bacteroidota bacterium]
MRKLTILALALFPGISVYLFFTSGSAALPKRMGDAMEDNARERHEYEFNRLVSPDGTIPDHIREKELAFAATLPSDASLRAQNGRAPQAFFDPRGPWNVGGRTRAFAIDVTDETHFIAGTTCGGIWSTTTSGAGWNKMTTLNTYHGITCIAQDKRPGHTNTWYTGSGEAYGQSASGGSAYFLGNGMLKSTDNGMTWTGITPTITNTPQTFESFWDMIWNVALDENDTVNDVVYTACMGAVYKSINGGTNWTTVRGGNLSAYSYFTDVAVTKDSGIVYATLSSDGPAVSRGIWRSVDQGGTWAHISTSLFGDSLCNRIVMGINPSNENELYFLANTDGIGMPDTNFNGDIEYNALWRYTYLGGDGSGAGGMWEDLSPNLPGGGVYGPFADFNAQGSYDLTVAVKPGDPNTVFIGGTNIYRNTNRFNDTANTEYIGGYEVNASLPFVYSYPDHHPDQHGFVFLPSNPDVLFSNNDGGIFRTNDCTAPSVTWTSLNNGYLTSMFYTCAIDHGTPGNNIIVAGAQDNGSWWTNSTNLQTPWVTPRGGDGSYCQIADGQSMYYFSIQKGKMNKAQLDGSGAVTGYRRIDPIGIDKDDYLFINPFTLDPNNNNIMYLAGAKYLWRNDDLSAIPLSNQFDSISTNWVQWTDSVPTVNSKITALAVSKTPANRVYYGTDKKNVYRVDNAHTGTPTPVSITNTGFPATGYVSCIAVNPNNADELLVVFSNYGVYSLWHSADGGTTWAKAAGNLEQTITGGGNGPSLRWAAFLPVSDGMIYLVAGSTGVYATDTLLGTNTVWVQQGANSIGNVVCDMIDVRTSDGLVVVATHANGIYTANFTSVNDIVTVHDQVKPNFSMTVFPNPAISDITIEFDLPRAARVRIDLLDERGRLVQALPEQVLSAGKQKSVIENKNLPAGVYYCRLIAGELVQTKAISIIR